MISVTEKTTVAKRGQQFMRGTQRVLVICGAMALSYVGLMLLSARMYQKDAELNLEQQIYAQGQHEISLPKMSVKEGEVLGRIEIPRIKVSVVVLQGTTSQTLLHGVGHIEGTALPGEPGNIGIAGHRDTFLRALKDIHNHDEINIQTAAGIIRYEVDWIQITVPTDGAIVFSTTGSALTIVTCYPFHYIGAAPERFVVHAHRQGQPEV
jgi:sortase A